MRRFGLLLLLSGCTSEGLGRAESQPPAAARAAERELRDGLLAVPHLPNGLEHFRPSSLGGLEVPDEIPGLKIRPHVRMGLVGETSPTSEHLNAISGATFDADSGSALAEAMAPYSQEMIDAYGVSLFSANELFGTSEEEGLCDLPVLEFPFEAGDADYEGRMAVNGYSHFAGEPFDILVELSDSCRDGLVTAGGDPDAAEAAGDCAHEEILEFFQDDSDCRACVQGGGAFDDCVDDGDCEAESEAWTWVTEGDGADDKGYYPMVGWYLLACAPHWYTFALVLYEPDDNGDLPGYYDHERWSYELLPFWHEDEGDAFYGAFAGGGGPRAGSTVGRGVFGFGEYLRPEGDEGTPFAGRRIHADSVTLANGIVFHDGWNTVPGYGAVSLPFPTEPEDEWFSWAYGPAADYAWGLNPNDFRPDGESQARDYLAALALKTTTNINGVIVQFANHDRCDPEAWTDLGDGRWHCSELVPNDPAWFEYPQSVDDVDGDGNARWWVAPLLTLGSSGLPDPNVPGGLVTHVSGAPGLERLEGCTYPTTLVPDVVAWENDYTGEDGASLMGQTFRFGKESDDQGIRVAMSTNRPRDFCPEGP